jgi:broad specificity phosphatase PhoE
MSTRIILIRHAATDTDGRLCGSLDVPLSMEGRRQVRALVAVDAAGSGRAVQQPVDPRP